MTKITFHYKYWYYYLWLLVNRIIFRSYSTLAQSPEVTGAELYRLAALHVSAYLLLSKKALKGQQKLHRKKTTYCY